MRATLCERRPIHVEFGDQGGAARRSAPRCDEAATYLMWGQGKNYLPNVGAVEGNVKARALGQRGRGSFTLWVLLGPSLAVGLALAGFNLTREATGLSVPPSGSPTASPSSVPLAGPSDATTSPTSPGSQAPGKTPDPRTAAPTLPPTSAPTAPPTAAPTAPPATNPPTTAPPIPTPTPVITLPPLPSVLPSLPHL